MEHGTEIAMGAWSVPQCPFRIEYAARVLDDIRLSVVDAFFSLPRGGAEIGGILLGEWVGDRLSITGFEPLDCEHASGPSFTLSARDQILLAGMTAAARSNPPERQPVGWYHSHTRSEIFLSDVDMDLHNRYFPERWQVALVLRPHTFEPTRAGFFFREPDGSMRSAASYQEFQLDPMPLRPVVGNGFAAGRRTGTEVAEPESPPVKGKRGVPITREIALDPPSSQKPEFAVPSFGQNEPDRPRRGLKAAAILATFLAAGGVGYETRQYWLTQVLTRARAVLPREPETHLSLGLSDDNGQLKIQWDRNAPAVRNGLDGTLQITDGDTAPQPVRLDGAHLAPGAFTYGRQSERVDVTLVISQTGGGVVKAQASFLGKLPAQKPAEDSEATKDRDAEAERADKLQKDVNFQASKIRKLEKELKEQIGKNNPPADPAKKN